MPSARRLFAFLSIVSLAAVLPASALAPVSPETIRARIEASQILPSDYRRHVNISVQADTVAVSVYRDPDADVHDCKIDAVLIADKVMEADPAAKTVSVAFFDLTEDNDFWQALVSTSAVKQYAQGAIGTDEIIRAVTMHTKQPVALPRSYRELSYKQMVDELGIVPGPMRDVRAVALVRIDKLQNAGSDVTELRNQFLHAEDLARRGDIKQLQVALRSLDETLEPQKDSTERIHRLRGLQALKPKLDNSVNQSVNNGSLN